MTRIAAVKQIMNSVKDADIVIASTGYISREVFKYDRPLNFYMMGSMGNALAIGMGLAMHIRNEVIVINGDGSALMSLGTLVTFKELRLPNLSHFILDNNCHESTGSQPTCSGNVIFNNIAGFGTYVYHIDKELSVPPRITLTPKQITERFRNAIQSLGNK